MNHYRVQIFGLNTWHDRPPNDALNCMYYPFTELERAKRYAKYCAFSVFEKPNPSRVIDEEGNTLLMCYPYFNRLASS